MMFCDSLAEATPLWVIEFFSSFSMLLAKSSDMVLINFLYFWALILSAGLDGSAAVEGFLNMPAGTARPGLIPRVALIFFFGFFLSVFSSNETMDASCPWVFEWSEIELSFS